ncbi:MAG TPA: T9SS type A sorting domain-containing protein, partial [Pelobium sp.]|nr:T9SS type A sorting domain-containing protein [Pelobium sp.]
DDVELAPIVHTFPSYDNSMEAPGQTVFYDIPEDGIKYIVIARSTGTSPKLYRIAASSTTFTALPLELLSFTAKADAFGKSVNLNWRTTNEVNTKDFSIERRTDNTDFVSIGTRNSQNTEGVHNYAFTDNDPVSGNAYYRLKQIDNDGKFTYSDIVSVNVTGGTSVSVYPNPTTDALNVGHGEGSNGSLSIFDLQGKSMISQALVNGSTNTAVNVANLTPGTYVLSIQNAGQQSTVKFIKK